MITINKPPMLDGTSAEDDIAALRSYLYSLATNLEQQLNMELDSTRQQINNTHKED